MMACTSPWLLQSHEPACGSPALPTDGAVTAPMWNWCDERSERLAERFGQEVSLYGLPYRDALAQACRAMVEAGWDNWRDRFQP